MIGAQGYYLRLTVLPVSYDWAFGDGATLHSVDPGEAPPSGDVRHAYLKGGTDAVTSLIQYGAEYTVITPFGAIGPLVVPGGPVRTVPVSKSLIVKSAEAGLDG